MTAYARGVRGLAALRVGAQVVRFDPGEPPVIGNGSERCERSADLTVCGGCSPCRFV